jgi:hypothetical protein
LLLYSSLLALGVSNWPVIYFINYTPTSSLALFIIVPSTSFSSAVAGDRRRRSSHIKYTFPRQLGTIKQQSSFSGAVAGEEEDFCKGSFRTHILYFVLSFSLLYFYLHRFIKNPKKLVFLIVVISLLLVHYVVP